MLKSLILLGATFTMGLAAGVFALYAHTIMPALKTTDDRTFVASFQALDRAIINPWFMVGGFVGALVLTGLAALTQLRQDPLPLILVALVLYLVTFVVTVAVNVPLNDAIKAAGDPDRITDLATVRARLPRDALGGVQPRAGRDHDGRVRVAAVGADRLRPDDGLTAS